MKTNLEILTIQVKHVYKHLPNVQIIIIDQYCFRNKNPPRRNACENVNRTIFSKIQKAIIYYEYFFAINEKYLLFSPLRPSCWLWIPTKPASTKWTSWRKSLPSEHRNRSHSLPETQFFVQHFCPKLLSPHYGGPIMTLNHSSRTTSMACFNWTLGNSVADVFFNESLSTFNAPLISLLGISLRDDKLN